jgi:hypothetical protein
MSNYPELETLVEAVNTLQQCRNTVSLGKERGATDEQLAELRRGVQSAVISVETAAVDLAGSENLRTRVDAAVEEAERRGML